jgi:HlyD family secretion protein
VTKVTSISETPQAATMGLSGAAMDRKAVPRTPWRGGLLAGAGIGLVLLIGWWISATLSAGRSLNVNQQRIVVSEVTTGTFEDFIPLRGRLVPKSTVYLDAIEGGRVEAVHIEDGAIVDAGDKIATLSNTNLQLEVLGRDAAVTEQLNNMRTIELQLEQNRLSHRRNLAEIDYQIKRLTRSMERQMDLASKNLVSQSTIDEMQDEIDYYVTRRDITLVSQDTDARMQEEQLRQLRTAGGQLETSLDFARENLDDLNVRAPVAGKLSGFNIDIGQSIERGGRLGQIDDTSAYKLNVRIDEFYLGRVDLQQRATASHQGRDLSMTVAKIYPQVNDGQFEVDMILTEEPDDLRRGQTLQLQLTLGDNTDAILIPNGSYYQETGGNWLFVVSPDGQDAIKRTVRLGRRNTEFIEVLDGLESGEKVITSPYTSFAAMDRLTMSAN